MLQKILIGVALAVLATGANAAGQQADAHASSVTVEGVQVAISPNGRLVAPTAEQRAALSRAMLQQPTVASPNAGVLGQPRAPRNEAEARATFHRFKLRNGHSAVGMALPEDRMSSLVAERRVDGSLSVHHAGDTPSAPSSTEVTK
ncbi:MAG TPA: hypothetical protein VFW82_11580 [Dyella sp.]|nr:hypothetical protein [Dyella sp.]